MFKNIFLIFGLFFMFGSATAGPLPAEGWIHNENWSVDPAQKCFNTGDLQNVSYAKQSVGVLNFVGETARITIDVPPGATGTQWANKSHAPKPSVQFSTKAYDGVCWDESADTCPDNKLTIQFLDGPGDTLAPRNKSYVSQNIMPLPPGTKKLYTYWTNMGENFGTTSMFSASVLFFLTDEACAARAGTTPPPVIPPPTEHYVNWVDDKGWIHLGDVTIEISPGVIEKGWLNMPVEAVYDSKWHH